MGAGEAGSGRRGPRGRNLTPPGRILTPMRRLALATFPESSKPFYFPRNELSFGWKALAFLINYFFGGAFQLS